MPDDTTVIVAKVIDNAAKASTTAVDAASGTGADGDAGVGGYSSS